MYFSGLINLFLHGVSLVINFREIFDNPSVQYNQPPTREEQEMANEHSYRLLTVFVLQLIAMTYVYVLGAYHYESIVRSTSVD